MRSILLTHWLNTIAFLPLAATSSMSATESFKLGTAAGRRVEVTDLFQSQNKLEDMLDRQRLIELFELNDPFRFC